MKQSEKRDWTDAELDIIDSTPRSSHSAPKSKLTREQVLEIRRRADSLTTPWTVAGLAEEFGISKDQIKRIVNREPEGFADRAYEPVRYWREKRK